MGSGLIELVNVGAQDLYLTGTPQITLFKSIYRRHTNFAIETMRNEFKEDRIDFGKKLTCFLEKNADLVYKTNLVIEIPSVHLQIFDSSDQKNTGTDEEIIYDNAINEFNITDAFINFNIELYRQALKKIQPKNIISISDAIIFITPIITSLDPFGLIRNNFKVLLSTYGSVTSGSDLYKKIYTYDVLNTISLFVSNLSDISKINIINLVKVAADNSTKIHKEFYYKKQIALNNKLAALNLISNESSLRYSKFAWTKRLGHTILDYVEIQIGGTIIDKHFGDWINVWWELSRNIYHDDNYNKLIGNVEELTNFDNSAKPSYFIKIPLQFWFCRFLGLALPLISLSYYDVMINVKLREIEQCCYTDPSGQDMLNTINLQSAYIETEYIYLDADERRRFAQVAHEYLIEQVQYVEYRTFTSKAYNFEVPFSNPCKELIWVYQRDDFVNNEDGLTETQFYNYTLNRIPQKPAQTISDIIPPVFSLLNSISGKTVIVTNFNYIKPTIDTINKFKTGNPVLNSYITLNGFRVGEVFTGNDSNYLNTYRNSNTPSDGINVYAFGFDPEIHQPTGTVNLGVIATTNLIVTFAPDIDINNIKGTFRIYGVSYNILRFMAGMGGLAFTVAVN
jgi:hypothetical protein